MRADFFLPPPRNLDKFPHLRYHREANFCLFLARVFPRPARKNVRIRCKRGFKGCVAQERWEFLPPSQTVGVTPSVTSRQLPRRGSQGQGTEKAVNHRYKECFCVAKGVTVLCLLLKITRASRVSLRPSTTFAHTCAYGESVKAAMLYCCHLSPPRENTLSGIYAVQWVVSQYHDFFFHQFERKSVNYTSCTIGRIIGDCLVFLKR